MIGDALFDRWEQAWSGRDPSAFDAICAPGLHYEDPLCRDPLQGAGELAAHAERLWAGFPDARMEKTGARLAEGRFVAAPCKVLGHHRKPLEGLPATGRFVVVHCVFYCELQGGLLYRVRGFFDLYAAAVQLGVLPSPGTMGERALLMLRGFGLRARGERP